MPVKLSIIIVNYNVRYFLENTLRAAVRACAGIEAEIIVVDNNSRDESRAMMQAQFPEIQYHYLTENLGFSKANNLAIRKAKGAFILLLNPDTIVAEDSFSKCIEYMEQHPEVGGLGVKMIDGEGRFLPESKRGLPTPRAAFYKIFGLSQLFPSSRRFGKYHLGYLDPDHNHEVEILSGAYMFMRKAALDQVGLLDEDYFMYGEDIDLSYRLIKGGYVNAYFAGTRIIHYKGESTKKGSLNYVFVFYRAMVIFARKHFEKRQASWFGTMINAAIYFRAFLAMLSRVFGRSWQFILDFVLIYLVFLATTGWYENVGHKDFDLPFISLALPAYALVLCATLFFAGAYDQPFRFPRLFRGWFAALAILLACYALLPESYRFSRAVILFGSTAALGFGAIWRWLASRMLPAQFIIGDKRPKRRLVVGNEGDLLATTALLEASGLPNEFLAGISPSGETRPTGFIGHLDNIAACVEDFRIQEVIFSASGVSAKASIACMEQLSGSGVLFKHFHHPPSSSTAFLIGPMDCVREPEVSDGKFVRQINATAILRTKRTTDLLVSTLFLVLSPVLMWFCDNPGGFVRNTWKVLRGSRTWVGLDTRGLSEDLPPIKPGIIHPMIDTIWPEKARQMAIRANIQYLKRHHFLMDLSLMGEHFQLLGVQRYDL